MKIRQIPRREVERGPRSDQAARTFAARSIGGAIASLSQVAGATLSTRCEKAPRANGNPAGAWHGRGIAWPWHLHLLVSSATATPSRCSMVNCRCKATLPRRGPRIVRRRPISVVLTWPRRHMTRALSIDSGPPEAWLGARRPRFALNDFESAFVARGPAFDPSPDPLGVEGARIGARPSPLNGSPGDPI